MARFPKTPIGLRARSTLFGIPTKINHFLWIWWMSHFEFHMETKSSVWNFVPSQNQRVCYGSWSFDKPLPILQELIGKVWGHPGTEKMLGKTSKSFRMAKLPVASTFHQKIRKAHGLKPSSFLSVTCGNLGVLPQLLHLLKATSPAALVPKILWCLWKSTSSADRLFVKDSLPVALRSSRGAKAFWTNLWTQMECYLNTLLNILRNGQILCSSC